MSTERTTEGRGTAHLDIPVTLGSFRVLHTRIFTTYRCRCTFELLSRWYDDVVVTSLFEGTTFLSKSPLLRQAIIAVGVFLLVELLLLLPVYGSFLPSALAAFFAVIVAAVSLA